MGVYGALLTGVTGLQGQSTKMGAISDNIANVNTVGYKKADIPFQSLVTDPFARATSYSAGGVLAKPRQLISQQGVITGTASATDMAISGRGFFIVSEETTASIDNSRFYTRAGSFRAAIDPDDPQKALLQNTGGFYLTGIPVTDRNNLPEPTSLTQLETVDVNRLTNLARATENVKTQANLAGEATREGAIQSIFASNGQQLAFLDGTATDPDNITVTLGDISVTTSNNQTLTLDAASYQPLIAAATIQGGGGIAGGGDFTIPADLTLTVNGEAATIPGTAGAPITQAALVAAINGTTVTPTTTGYTLAAQVDGDRIVITATNNTTNASVTTANVAGVTAIAGGTPASVNGFAVDANPNLREVMSALNTYQDPARITASSAAIVDLNVAAAASISFTINNGTSTLSLTKASITGAGTGFTSGVSTVANLATAINNLAAGSVTDSASNTYTLVATTNAAGDELTIRVLDSTGTLQSVDAATLTAEDFQIGGVAPVVAADTGLDISAQIDSNGFVSVSATETSGTRADINLSNLDVDGGGNANIGAVVSGSTGDWGDLFTSDLTQTQLIYDALGSPHNVNLQYRKVIGAGESNLWEVNLTDSNVSDFVGVYDPTAADGNGARFVVQDTGGAIVETQRLFLKFNGDGSLNSIRTTEDGATGTAFGQRGGGTTTGVVANRETDAAADPKLVSIAIGPATVAANGEAVATPISPIPTGANVFTDTGSGAATTAQAVVYEWNVGRPTGLTGSAVGTGLDGLTQFDSGEATPTIETNFYSQDGARLGNISGVQVDTNGTLFALYDNGLVEPIYVLPVATFNNPDGLINYSGNIFAESGDSGQVQLKRAGDQGAGDILGSSVENSNVDLGDEFTNMIITQQSFTANTRTITTSDRMLEELVRILR